MTTPGDDRARLEARNAAMKGQVDELLEQFNRQTEQLKDAQAAAAALSVTVTSSDGLVRVTVDASGMLSNLEFAPSTFDRTKPDALARTVTELAQRATLQVKQQAAELMRPLTEGMPDLSDFFEGAPSLAELIPEIPEFTPPPKPSRPESFEDPDAGSILRTRPRTPPPPPKPTTRRARPAPEEDEDMPDSWLTDRRDR